MRVYLLKFSFEINALFNPYTTLRFFVTLICKFCYANFKVCLYFINYFQNDVILMLICDLIAFLEEPERWFQAALVKMKFLIVYFSVHFYKYFKWACAGPVAIL